MKNTNDIGKVYRYLPEYNYRALWEDNKTIRFMLEGRLTDPISLPEDQSEFYDIGINDSCNASCDFCYVSAGKTGENFLRYVKLSYKLRPKDFFNFYIANPELKLLNL